MDLPATDWLRAFRVYLGAIAIGNLAWETLQLPLYIGLSPLAQWIIIPAAGFWAVRKIGKQ